METWKQPSLSTFKLISWLLDMVKRDSNDFIKKSTHEQIHAAFTLYVSFHFHWLFISQVKIQVQTIRTVRKRKHVQQLREKKKKKKSSTPDGFKKSKLNYFRVNLLMPQFKKRQ